jgi:hypothetical protein
MDDSGSASNTPDPTGQPPAGHAAPVIAAQAPKMVRARAVPTSTLVLGTILLVVAGSLGGWVAGHHAAQRSDRMAFAFMRQHEGFGSRAGQGGFGGFLPGSGSGYGPGYAPGPGSWCAPCYGTNAGASVPCSSGMPGYAPGATGPGQPVPTAVPGGGGSQGSSGSQGSGS